MVLQRAPAKAVVWGFGKNGAKVVLSLSGFQEEFSTTVINGKYHLHKLYYPVKHALKEEFIQQCIFCLFTWTLVNSNLGSSVEK